MELMFFIVSIIITTTYGVKIKCTAWDKNANNTLPCELDDNVIELLQDYIPVVTTDNDVFDIKSAVEDFNRGSKNEDIHCYITELIEKYGYPVEVHEVTTSDGYTLRMFRIPGNGSVTLLMHGLFGSADDFLRTGKERSLAITLAKEGYDVWLGNTRGNVHSRRNIYLSPDCKEFWDFSWDDSGRKDLPAMIDYILDETNQKSLQYIGYTQGTTSFYVMCSEKPEYNEKISIMISLTTATWISHTRSVLLRAVALLISLSLGDSSALEYFFGYELLPRNAVINAITDVACKTPETATIFCDNLFMLAFGFDYAQINATYLPDIFAHLPAGGSAKQLLHYGQIVSSGKFCQYDHGDLENMKRYGSRSPPDYPVEKITARVVPFQGPNDISAPIEDVRIFLNKLPNFNESDLYMVPFDKFSHLDFLIANDLKTLVHDKILEVLKNN